MYDLLFVVNLRSVIQILPFASAAMVEVLAKRLATVGRGRNQTLDFAFGKCAFLFLNKYIHHIARDGAFDKNRQPFGRFADTLASIRYTVDTDVFQYQLLSCHATPI